MHPNTPALLADLVTAADRMIKAEDAFVHPQCEPGHLAALLAGIQDLHRKPAEGERLIDDVTVWLAQALHNAAREGRHGAPKKWIELARCFVPFVRSDLAAAIGAAHLPDAPDGMGRPA